MKVKRKSLGRKIIAAINEAIKTPKARKEKCIKDKPKCTTPLD